MDKILIKLIIEIILKSVAFILATLGFILEKFILSFICYFFACIIMDVWFYFKTTYKTS